MAQRDLRLDLRIETDWDCDDAALITLAADLHDELAGLEIVTSVMPTTAGPAPPGARSIDPIVAGALTVILAESLDRFLGVIDKVQSWVNAFQDGRKVEIEIEGQKLIVTKLSRRTRDELIQVYLDRVKKRDGIDDRH
ncbi:MAG TPA: hypothetical protein VFO16_07875 [Pseudonocardiaceae bacterium]|nr:hypothetical protein [Pseudonocardiaceae bacterium]